MRAVFLQAFPDRRAGRRSMAFALVLGVHLFLALVLLLLAPPRPAAPPEANAVVLMDFPAPQAKRKPAPVKRAEAAAAKKAPVAAPVPPPVVPPDATLFDLQLFEGVDISKLPNVRQESAAAGDTGAGKDSSTAYGPGEGPGGARLYDAEWVREPTHAELAFYLPRGAPQGAWALIACRTVEKFRVEDCRELGDAPPGSGLARAVTQAAWQFRVRPPRIDGRAVVGAWVRIRIDFSEREAG